jgi:hypothetical protein
MFTAFKIYKADFYLRNKIYKNSGVLKDAERFSLIDPVLDGEYNDFQPRLSNHLREKTLPSSGKLKNTLQVKLSRFAFRTVLYLRLITYLILHIKYKPM